MTGKRGWTHEQRRTIGELFEELGPGVWETPGELRAVVRSTPGRVDLLELEVLECKRHPELVGLTAFTWEQLGSTASCESIHDYWKHLARLEVHVLVNERS